MDIGELRHRITVRGYTSKKDDLGGKPKTFADKFSCFAGVNVDNGEKLTRAERFERNLTIHFLIRYREDITPDDRIVFQGREFRITDIYPDALKTRINIEAEEVME